MTRHTLVTILIIAAMLAVAYVLMHAGDPFTVLYAYAEEYTATGTNVTAGIDPENGTAWAETPAKRCEFTFTPGALVEARCSDGTGWSYDGNPYYYIRPVPGYALPPGVNGIDITDSVSISTSPNP